MGSAYDDRDGKIWFDGKLVDWRDANVHVLTHAMHYASSVFEGERAYSGKIFKSRAHSERLIQSGKLIDFDIPYSVDEIEAAKYVALEANGLTDASCACGGLAWCRRRYGGRLCPQPSAYGRGSLLGTMGTPK